VGPLAPTLNMFWSQDVVISVLFPYLLPSLPICEQDCWSGKKFKSILEYLLTSFCHVSLEKTQGALEIFIRRIFSVSCDEISLDNDLKFLANIKDRSTFGLRQDFSEAYSFYATSFLIENGANIYYENDRALQWASGYGHRNVVALLLEQKANVHAKNDYALRWASENGHRDVATLLLEHKANVHANSDYAIRWAIQKGHTNVVALLLEHKADVHVIDDYAIRPSYNNQKDIEALLLEHRADVHAKDDRF
jgi:ankyrin repeat protein